MELNKLKFQLLQHGSKDELKLPYKIDVNTQVEKSTDVKDLGVLISEDLSFNTHIMNMTNDAKRHAGWILRLIKSRDPEIVLLLFKTYVRPRLEYASPLWSPHLIKHITKIEAVQRTVTSKIQGMENFNYWERLKHLDILSLQRRRERYQIVHIWKISKGLIPNDLKLEFYETSRYGIKCKRPKYNQRQRYISSLKFNSFTSNGPALFNIVPVQVKKSQTLNTFKSRLQSFLTSFPDTPPTPNYMAQNKNSLLEWAASSTNSQTLHLYELSDEDAAPEEETSQSLSSFC